MNLKGFYPPFTKTGKSALVGTPPWHFSGEFLVVDYQAEPDAVAAMLPPGLEPADDAGACSVFFGEYQCCSEDRAELEIPHLSQYKESGITIAANYKGQRTNYMAYIWTSKDFSLLRGNIQGYAKGIGDIEMTRVFNLGNATPKLAEGGKFVSAVTVHNRLIARAGVTLTGPATGPANMQKGGMTTMRCLPPLGDDSDGVLELTKVKNENVEVANAWEGEGALKFSEDAGEDILALAPISITKGMRYDMAFTIAGGKVLERLSFGDL